MVFPLPPGSWSSMTAKISSSQKLLILLSMKPLSPAIHPCIFHEKAKILKRFGRRLMWSKSEEGFPVHWHCAKFSHIYRILVLMPWFGDVVLPPFRLLRLVLEGVFAFLVSLVHQNIISWILHCKICILVDLLWTLFAKADFLLTQGFEDLYKILDTVHQESRPESLEICRVWV